MHEFADTGRPITAAFAGAPGNAFTVFGATPQRNAAVLGLPATTTIAEATQIYLRYDGEIASGTDNHAVSVGVRFLVVSGMLPFASALSRQCSPRFDHAN